MALRRFCLTCALLFSAATAVHAQSGAVTFAQVRDSARLAPAADTRISYGISAAQFAELRLPSGAGPHPVVFLIHGGCWLNAYGVDHVAGIAESLRRSGVAVFAVEYRRVGDEGAGYPGTFDDVRSAYDSLLAIAPRQGLDPSRILLMGHSAGGQLALWLASERQVRVKGVVALAAVTDLAAFVAPSGCGAAVSRLMGGSADSLGSRYEAAAPVSRPAPAVSTRVLLVTADGDRTVPAAQADAYIAKFPGTPVERVPGAHFDLVAPWTPAWARVLAATTAFLSSPEGRAPTAPRTQPR
jgi:acetyl esterase/lipase